MAEATSARIELLTAEVRTLMVGSRQITLSVVRQLDEVSFEQITAFGRIRTGRKPGFAEINGIEVVGSSDGKLARSWASTTRYMCWSTRNSGGRAIHSGREVYEDKCDTPDCPERWRGHMWTLPDEVMDEWAALPLIVLAGLR